MIHRCCTDHFIRGELPDKMVRSVGRRWPTIALDKQHFSIQRTAHDKSNIHPSNWHFGNGNRGLRKQPSGRHGRAISRRAERLRTLVGNLAINSRRGQRKTRARKRGTKYNSHYRSQHVPTSEGKSGGNISSRALHGKPGYQAQTSGLDCRRRTECRSGDARDIRDHRRDALSLLLRPARWPAPDRVPVASGQRTDSSALEENRTSAFALIPLSSLCCAKSHSFAGLHEIELEIAFFKQAMPGA